MRDLAGHRLVNPRHLPDVETPPAGSRFCSDGPTDLPIDVLRGGLGREVPVSGALVVAVAGGIRYREPAYGEIRGGSVSASTSQTFRPLK